MAFIRALGVDEYGELVQDEGLQLLEGLDEVVGVVGVISCEGVTSRDGTISSLLHGDHCDDVPNRPSASATGLYVSVVTRPIVNKYGEVIKKVVMDIRIKPHDPASPRLFAAACAMCSTVVYCLPSLSTIEVPEEEEIPYSRVRDDRDTTLDGYQPSRRRSSGWAVADEAQKIRSRLASSAAQSEPASTECSPRRAARVRVPSINIGVEPKACTKCGSLCILGESGKQYASGVRCTKCQPKKVSAGTQALQTFHSYCGMIKSMLDASEAHSLTMPGLAWVIPPDDNMPPQEAAYFLEWAVAEKPDDTFNDLRRAVRSLFPIRWSGTPADVRAAMSSRLRGKQLSGIPLPGRLLISAIRTLMQPLSLGQAPPLHLPWAKLAEVECSKVINETLSSFSGDETEEGNVWCAIAEKVARYGDAAVPLIPEIKRNIDSALLKQEQMDATAKAERLDAAKVQIEKNISHKTDTAQDWQAWACFMHDCVAALRREVDGSLALNTVIEWFLTYGKAFHNKRLREAARRCEDAEVRLASCQAKLDSLELEEEDLAQQLVEAEGRLQSMDTTCVAHMSSLEEAVSTLTKRLQEAEQENEANAASLTSLSQQNSDLVRRALQAEGALHALQEKHYDEGTLQHASMENEIKMLQQQLEDETQTHDEIRVRLAADIKKAEDALEAANKQIAALCNTDSAAEPFALPQNPFIQGISAKAQAEHNRTLALLQRIDAINTPEVTQLEQDISEAYTTALREKAKYAAQVEALQRENDLCRDMVSKNVTRIEDLEQVYKEKLLEASSIREEATRVVEEKRRAELPSASGIPVLASFMDATRMRSLDVSKISTDPEETAARLRLQVQQQAGEIRSLKSKETSLTEQLDSCRDALSAAEHTASLLREDRDNQDTLVKRFRQEISSLKTKLQDATRTEQAASLKASTYLQQKVDAFDRIEQLQAQYDAIKIDGSMSTSQLHDERREAQQRSRELAASLERCNSASKAASLKIKALEAALETEQAARHEEVVELQSLLEASRKEAAASSVDMHDVRQQIKELELSIVHHKKTGQAKEEELHSLRNQLSELRRHSDQVSASLTKQLSEEREVGTKLRLEMQRLEIVTASSQEEVSRLERMCNKLQDERHQQQSQVLNLERRLSAHSHEMQVKISNAESAAISAEKEATMSVVNLRSQMEQRAEEVTTLRAERAEAEERISALQKQLSAATVQAQGLELRGKEMTNQLNSLQEARDTSRSEVKKQQEDHSAALNQLRESMRQQQKQLSRDKDELEAKLDDSRREAQLLKIDNVKKQHDLELLQKFEAMCEHKTRELKEKDEKLAELEVQLVVAREKLSHMETSARGVEENTSSITAALEKQCDLLSSQKNELQAECRVLREENEDLKAVVNELTSMQQQIIEQESKKRIDLELDTNRKLSRAQEQIDELAERVSDLVKENDNLQAQLASERHNVASLQKQCNALKQASALAEKQSFDLKHKMVTMEEATHDAGRHAEVFKHEKARLQKQISTLQETLESEQKKLRQVKSQLMQSDVRLNKELAEKRARARVGGTADIDAHIASQRELLQQNMQMMSDLGPAPPSPVSSELSFLPRSSPRRAGAT